MPDRWTCGVLQKLALLASGYKADSQTIHSGFLQMSPIGHTAGSASRMTLHRTHLDTRGWDLLHRSLEGRAYIGPCAKSRCQKHRPIYVPRGRPWLQSGTYAYVLDIMDVTVSVFCPFKKQRSAVGGVNPFTGGRSMTSLALPGLRRTCHLFSFAVSCAVWMVLLATIWAGHAAAQDSEADVFVASAILAYEDKRYEEALRLLGEAPRLDPKNEEAL